MKYLLLLAFLLTGCASTRGVQKGPCDGVVNREKKFVCGKGELAQDCNPVMGTDEFVCKPW